MTLFESLRTALRSLLANPLRSVLTMLGVVIGVAAVIALLALGNGAEQRIEEQIRSLGANLLLIRPGSGEAGGARLGAGTRPSLTAGDATAIAAEIPSALIAVPAVQTAAQVVFGARNWGTTVAGVWPDHLAARDWALAEGRSFSIEELDRAAKVAVVGQTIVGEVFDGEDPVGQRVRIGDVPFKVIGTLSAKGGSPFGTDQDDVILVPLSTAKLRLSGGTRALDPRAVEYIYVKARSAAAVADAKRQIEALLRQRHDLRPGAPDDFKVDDLASLVAAQQQAGRTFTVFLGVVASISLIVGGVSIMNIMLVSVTERTREIGIRLAIGARRRDLRNQFLIEAVVLCLAGAAAGVLIGWLAAQITGNATGWPVSVAPWSIGLAVGFAAAIGVFFGFYPAQKASRLDPVEALRHE